MKTNSFGVNNSVVISNIYDILRLRDFRLFWAHTSLWTVGEVATFIGQGWLVLSLSGDSPLWVGVASGMSGLGHITCSLIGGILADRRNRRLVISLVALTRAVIFSILAILILNDMVQLWHVLVIVCVQGGTIGINAPSFNGLIYDMVGPKRLMNGVAYTLTAFHVSWAIGSVLTGHLVNTTGIGAAYALAAFLCLLSIIPLTKIEAINSIEAAKEPISQGILRGIRYVAKNRFLRLLLLLSILVETFGFSYLVMLPVIAKTVLAVGPKGLGYLSSAGGIGSIIGTVAVASLGDFKNKWKLLTIGTASAGIGIFLFGTSPWYPLSLLLTGLIGFFLVTYDATINTLLQTVSEDDMRGRVLGLYGMTWGFTPLGGFLSGSVASIAGAPFAVALGGVVILTYTLGVLARVNQNRNTESE